MLQAENIKVVNGGILALEFNAKTIKFKNKIFYPIKDNYFLLPISYKTPLKTYSLKVNKNIFYIDVEQGNYKKDILKVNKSKTHLNKKQLQRAIKEVKKIKKLYSQYIPTQYKSNFIYPLNSKYTSLYGNSRIFNNIIKSYHSGLDFRAKVDTEIKASNSGRVVFAGDLFYSGKCVIINHGDYVFTIYAHLNKINVKKNEYIKKSQIIALSGKSGRVTGAHLHFGTIVNGIKVNPKDFIHTINSIIKNKKNSSNWL